MLQEAKRTATSAIRDIPVSSAPPRFRVLVVEDEAVSAVYFEDILSGFGCEVVATADTASRAMAAAEEHRPDLVLTDVRLRQGDGIEAATTIRERLGIPFILATAYSDAHTQQRVAAARPLDFLEKPVGVSAIQRTLEGRSAHPLTTVRSCMHGR